MSERELVAKPLPNFMAYCNERFGDGWVVSKNGPVTARDFRRAKADHEGMTGVRVYSHAYWNMFHEARS